MAGSGDIFYVYNYDDRDHPRGLNWCNWRFDRFTWRDGHSGHDGAGLCETDSDRHNCGLWHIGHSYSALFHAGNYV